MRVSCGEGKRASNKFAEYEIACQMSFSAGTLFEIKSLLKWSVWKRFSEFKSMDKVIAVSLYYILHYCLFFCADK